MQKSKYHILFYLITPMFSSIYYEIANIIVNKGQIPTWEGVRNIWRRGPSFLEGIELFSSIKGDRPFPIFLGGEE